MYLHYNHAKITHRTVLCNKNVMATDFLHFTMDVNQYYGTLLTEIVIYSYGFSK